MNKEQENQFKENIKEIARLELKNSFNNNLMETLNSAFIFKYVDTLEKQCKKQKEIIDKLSKIIYEIDNLKKTTGGYPSHYLDKLLDILNEVK